MVYLCDLYKNHAFTSLTCTGEVFASDVREDSDPTCEDSERLDQKWSVDAKALANKLETLSPGAAISVGNAIEEYWGRYGLSDRAAVVKLLTSGLSK
jgi:hypothetical protein